MKNSIISPVLFIIISFVLINILGCEGCKEEVEMPDPCEGVTETNADFTISYGIGWNEDRRYFESDTILHGYIRFEAINDLDSCKWTIGTDARIFTKKSFELFFDDVLGKIDVRLIGYKKPDNLCFPEDDGIDTVYKSFTIVPATDSPIFGEFEGYYESEPDSICSINIALYYPTVWIDEFPRGCVREDHELALWIGYKEFFMDYDGYGVNCPLPRGWGYYNDDGTLEVDFYYWKSNGEKINDKFIGIKK